MNDSNYQKNSKNPFRKARAKVYKHSWGRIAIRSAFALLLLFAAAFSIYDLIVFGRLPTRNGGYLNPIPSFFTVPFFTFFALYLALRVYEDIRYKLSDVLPDRLKGNVTDNPSLSDSLDEHTYIRTKISLLNRTGIKVTAETVYGTVYLDRAGKTQVEWEMASEHFYDFDKRHLTDPHVEVESGDYVSTTCFRSDTRESESPSCAGVIWANHHTGEVSSPSDKKLTEVVVWGLTMMGFSGLHLLQYAFCMGTLFACAPAGYVYFYLGQSFPAAETGLAGLAGIAFGVVNGRRLLFSGKPKAINDFIAFARAIEKGVRARIQATNQV